MSSHLAAIQNTKGTPLEVKTRLTPTPGPKDLLIEVKSIAFNPIDWKQRDFGIPPIIHYPTVLGSDIAGIVISAGPSVPASAPKVGTRVCAFAPCFYTRGDPDYGAMQTKVLVPGINASPIPDSMSFNEATLLPMAVATAWAGWSTIGVGRDTLYKKEDKKGVLVWGGSSSVGSAVVQIAKMMGFTVYATAGAKNHEQGRTLGASRVFDYKGDDVVGSIVKAAKEDGLTIAIAYDAAGALESILQILTQLKGGDEAKVASAIHLNDKSPSVKGVEAKFVMAPPGDEARDEHFQFIFNHWLKEKVSRGEFVPSPGMKVVEGGLESADKALNELKNGVSGVKLVIEM